MNLFKKVCGVFLLSFIAIIGLAQNKKAINVSLLLPFCSQQILDNPNHQNAELGNVCREYYQGALIALDSFENAKCKVRLCVFDTENDSLKTTTITQKTSFKESELIIGPVKPGGNQVVGAFSKKEKVFHVSPLMTLSKTKLNDPFWISANPDLPSYGGILLSQILLKDSQPNIIVIADKSTFGKGLAAGFKNLDKKGATVKVLEYMPTLNVQTYINPNTNNHLVIASNSESIVQFCLRNIKDTIAINGLHTYGFMQWFDFKNVDYPLYMRCNTHFISPFFVDYEHEFVKSFIKKYREKYNTDPTESAFKGYDQFLFFTNQVALYGKNFVAETSKNKSEGLTTRFVIRLQPEGWYQNIHLFILALKDNKLKLVN